MIMNPVIQGGAEEKVYKITDRSNLYIGLQSAKAGEFVLSSVVIEYPQDKQPVSTVKTVDGYDVPVSFTYQNSVPLSTTGRVMINTMEYFIMPASDVIIS